eukprot:TRINITY_DN14987_c0_g1_i1.p1 TRINITY_DN14987_c0_g1~~TRINITY_DN14987_c0_g1_i1.p1  ORF type:complete len:379 (+),score=129.42 TRINITY_DN14987_c0_g1_i1:77-1213(+)
MSKRKNKKKGGYDYFESEEYINDMRKLSEKNGITEKKEEEDLVVENIMNDDKEEDITNIKIVDEEESDSDEYNEFFEEEGDGYNEEMDNTREPEIENFFSDSDDEDDDEEDEEEKNRKNYDELDYSEMEFENAIRSIKLYLIGKNMPTPKECEDLRKKEPENFNKIMRDKITETISNEELEKRKEERRPKTLKSFTEEIAPFSILYRRINVSFIIGLFNKYNILSRDEEGPKKGKDQRVKYAKNWESIFEQDEFLDVLSNLNELIEDLIFIAKDELVKAQKNNKLPTTKHELETFLNLNCFLVHSIPINDIIEELEYQKIIEIKTAHKGNVSTVSYNDEHLQITFDNENNKKTILSFFLFLMVVLVPVLIKVSSFFID